MWISVYVCNHHKPEVEFFANEQEAIANFTEFLEDEEVEITEKILSQKAYSFYVNHNDEPPYSWHIIIKEVPTTFEVVK